MDETEILYVRYILNKLEKIDNSFVSEKKEGNFYFKSKSSSLGISINLGSIEIIDIHVKKNYRKNKIGSKILDVLKEFGTFFSFYNLISTNVKNTNEALNFWRSNDFKEQGGTSFIFILKKNIKFKRTSK